MVKIFFGVFMMLHGLVHILYGGQSTRLFELKPGLTWPDGAWAFSKLLGIEAARKTAAVSLIIAAVMFLVGGISLLAGQEWWKLAAASAAIFSTLIYLLCWDGQLTSLPDKGFIGILINIAIMAVCYYKPLTTLIK